MDYLRSSKSLTHNSSDMQSPIQRENVHISRAPQTLNISRESIATNLVQELEKKDILSKEQYSLKDKLSKVNGNLKNVAFWILGIFTLFIPQIIFGFQKMITENKLKKVDVEIIKAGDSVKVLNAELNKASNALKQAETKVNETGKNVERATQISKGVKRKASDAENNYNKQQVKRLKLEKKLETAGLKLEKAQATENLIKKQEEVKARIAARRDAAAALKGAISQGFDETSRENLPRLSEATQKRWAEEGKAQPQPENIDDNRILVEIDLEFKKLVAENIEIEAQIARLNQEVAEIGAASIRESYEDLDSDSDDELAYVATPPQEEYTNLKAAVKEALTGTRKTYDELASAHGNEAEAEIAEASAKSEQEQATADLKQIRERMEALREGLVTLREKRAKESKLSKKPPVKPIQAVRNLIAARDVTENKPVAESARDQLRNLELSDEQKLLDRVKALHEVSREQIKPDSDMQAKEIFDEFLKLHSEVKEDEVSHEAAAPTLEEKLAAARELSKKLDAENLRRLQEKSIKQITLPSTSDKERNKRVTDALHAAGKNADVNGKRTKALREALKAEGKVAAEEAAKAGRTRIEAKAKGKVAAEEAAKAGSTIAEAKAKGKDAAEEAAKAGRTIAEAKAKGKVAAEKAAKVGSTIAEAKAKGKDVAEEAAKAGRTIAEAKAKGKDAAEEAAKVGSTIAEAKAKGKVAAEEAAKAGRTRIEAKEVANATMIQSVVRGWIGKNQYRKQISDVTTIQSLARGLAAKKMLKKLIDTKAKGKVAAEEAANYERAKVEYTNWVEEAHLRKAEEFDIELANVNHEKEKLAKMLQGITRSLIAEKELEDLREANRPGVLDKLRVTVGGAAAVVGGAASAGGALANSASAALFTRENVIGLGNFALGVIRNAVENSNAAGIIRDSANNKHLSIGLFLAAGQIAIREQRKREGGGANARDETSAPPQRRQLNTLAGRRTSSSRSTSTSGSSSPGSNSGAE